MRPDDERTDRPVRAPGANHRLRIALNLLAAVALAMFAFCEIGMAAPVPGWLYLSVAIAFAAGLIRPGPRPGQRWRLSVLGAVVAFMATLHFVDWTTRKPFLRDLARVRVGMNESEVRRIMERYIEGSGWTAGAIDNSTNATTSTLTDLGSGSQYSTVTTPTGEMTVQNALIFRHSNDGRFNSDWGIISLASGRVVKVEFSPD